MITLAEALEDLAQLLELRRKKKPAEDNEDFDDDGAPPAAAKKRTLLAAAALSFDSHGNPTHPHPIRTGDELTMQRTHEPGAGTLSLSRQGMPYGKALEPLDGGETGEIEVQLYYKRSVPDGDPCEECLENADAGWIPVDEDYPNGEPGEVHPNCKCGEIFSDEGDGEE